jgi:hypothetical protein
VEDGGGEGSGRDLGADRWRAEESGDAGKEENEGGEARRKKRSQISRLDPEKMFHLLFSP